MKTIKGPATFPARLASAEAPFDRLPAIARRTVSYGHVGVRIPIRDGRPYDPGDDTTAGAERCAGRALPGLDR